jgi:hypothetical protein
MNTKNYILLATSAIASFFLARYFFTKQNAEGKKTGLLSREEIESLYAEVKL